MGDKECYYSRLNEEYRAILDDALEQASELRRMAEVDFQNLQNANSLSLHNWDNLISHLNRQKMTCERVLNWYQETIHLPLSHSHDVSDPSLEG